MTASQPAVPDELVKRAATAYNRASAVGDWGLGAALAAVADDLRAEGRPAVCRGGCQVQAWLVAAATRRDEPSQPDDRGRLAQRAREAAEASGIAADLCAEARRECAAELRAEVERLRPAWALASKRLPALADSWERR